MARQLTTHLSCWCMFGDQNSSHSAGDAVQISSRRHDKVTILDLSGDIDCANSRQLRESVLREIQENRTSHVMVNLSAGRYIDSSGIASLVEALKAVRGSFYSGSVHPPGKSCNSRAWSMSSKSTAARNRLSLRWALRLRSQGITIQSPKTGNSGPTGDAMTSTGTTPTCRILTLRKERALQARRQ